MSKFDSMICKAFISFLLLFFLAGSSSASVMAIIDDQVDFGLGEETIFIEGTTGGDDGELADVPFSIEFHEGFVPDGDISKLVVKFTYDPDFLTFIGARPDPIWGSLTEGTDYHTVHDPVNGIIQFTIYPEIAPDLDVIAGIMTLAYFDFMAKCQAQENPNALTFTDIGGTTESSLDVELTAGGRNTYTPLTDYATPGSVTTEFYWVKTRGAYQIHRGILGTEITVPVSFMSNALLDGLTFQMEYDQTKLQFIGIEDWVPYFPGGFTDGNMPQAGDFPIYISLETGPTYDADLRGTTYQEIFKLRFLAIGDWDGSYTPVKWSYNYNDPDREFRIGNGTDSYCEEVTNSLPNNSSSIYFLAGYQILDEYAAGMESRKLGDIHVWNSSEIEQDLEFAIKLCNNFEAGTYQAGYDGAITAILNPPDILNYVYGPVDQIPGLGAFFEYAYSSSSHDTLSFYQDYKETGYSNVLDISACDLEGGIDILNLTFELDDDDVTEYSNDTYELEVVPNVSTFSGVTRVEASYSDKTMLPDDGLALSSIPFEIEMGEFTCNRAVRAASTTTQTYYIRNTFDVASFRVTVAVVAGPHYINVITPQPGVEVVEWDGTHAVLASNSEWVPAEHSTATEIANILYSRSAPMLASKVDPGLGDCYWKYYYSTIGLQNCFMSDLANDDPADPQGNQPFLFATGNTVGTATYICNSVIDDEAEDMADYKAAQEVIPTEFRLYQNYPNPFNPDTKVAFDLPVAAHVRIEIFNILGQHVATLVDEAKTAGSYEITWHAIDDAGQRVSSGIYLYHMQAGSFSRSAKMILMK